MVLKTGNVVIIKNKKNGRGGLKGGEDFPPSVARLHSLSGGSDVVGLERIL